MAGVSYSVPVPRVAVFIDYQNVYMGARRAFASSTTCHVDGQIDPLKVGGALTGMISSSRELVAVHVYRERPRASGIRRGTRLHFGRSRYGSSAA